MSVYKGEQLFDCKTCVNYFSNDRIGACEPCGEEFEGKILSVYCKVGCGHCLHHTKCSLFWSKGGKGNQQICLHFKIDPELDP